MNVNVTAPSYRPPKLPESRHFPKGFDGLYAGMLAEFDGRECFVFPDDAVMCHRVEEIGAKIRNLLLPFGEKKAATTEYYRAVLKSDGRILCETMPGNRVAFEIDREGRLVGGSGVPLREG